MRLLFIKDYTLEDGRIIRAGQNETLWDPTDALRSRSAIPYNQRYESQTKPKATPEGAGKDTEDPIKKKTNKSKTGGK